MTRICSGSKAVTLNSGAGTIIGERINPTGKKKLKEALERGDVAYVMREAVTQVEAGAAVLDVNCGVPGIDETQTLVKTIEAVESVVNVPLQVDTANPQALATALRRVNGKALVNSVNGKRESMAAVFPIVQKYGGVIVALCLDERGIPNTVEGRLAIARKILTEGAKYGFGKADFVFDALTLTVATDAQAARVTLETVKRLTEELGVNTVLGVSNVSFGLPNRAELNNAMYHLAKQAGLSAAIANPSAIRDEATASATAVLMGEDENFAEWLALNGEKAAPVKAVTTQKSTLTDLHRAIVSGLKADVPDIVEAIVMEKSALAVIDGGIVPALEEVGRGFETGKLFLPQLLMAADAAGAAFEVVKRAFPAQTEKSARGPMVLATVKGDIHDIGKNICRALLENYGFEVIDLGRDVEPQAIVEAAKRSQAKLVGLSALMTTTVGAMAETIKLMHQEFPACPVTVGGAVVTAEFAAQIHADYYTKDAMELVRLAARVEREA